MPHARAKIALSIGALLAAVAALSGCGSDAKSCASDAMCGSGFRCEKSGEGSKKVCVACTGEESRYDGIDNDCNPRTRDSDLDRDGDNWKGAAIAPGGDCDDEDPSVSSTIPEACGDQKDND